MAPPPVVQAPPTAESAVEPELVGDHDGMGLAVGIVSHNYVYMYMYFLIPEHVTSRDTYVELKKFIVS